MYKSRNLSRLPCQLYERLCWAAIREKLLNKLCTGGLPSSALCAFVQRSLVKYARTDGLPLQAALCRSPIRLCAQRASLYRRKYRFCLRGYLINIVYYSVP